jgi:hypothetical protein
MLHQKCRDFQPWMHASASLSLGQPIISPYTVALASASNRTVRVLCTHFVSLSCPTPSPVSDPHGNSTTTNLGHISHKRKAIVLTEAKTRSRDSYDLCCTLFIGARCSGGSKDLTSQTSPQALSRLADAIGGRFVMSGDLQNEVQCQIYNLNHRSHCP